MTDTAKIERALEAALFFNGGTMTIDELSRAVGTTPDDVRAGLSVLKESLEGRGIRLVIEGKTAALATSPESNAMIEKMQREELEGPLGKAGLETLSIIIFRGPLLRSDIEYVRGVNCSAILRSMMIRGLIERVENPRDKRSFLYQATAELPAYFGVGELKDIPGYAETRQQIEALFASREADTPKDSAEVV